MMSLFSCFRNCSNDKLHTILAPHFQVMKLSYLPTKQVTMTLIGNFDVYDLPKLFMMV